MKKIKKIFSTLGITIAISAFLFFGLKGMIVTIWSSPSEPTTYSVNGYDGQIFTMIFMPEHETIIYYNDPEKNIEEYVLTEMRGSYGEHYFWRIWHTEGPGIHFGYRIYPSGAKPVVMEIKTIQKYMNGSGNSNFPNPYIKTA